MYKGDVQRLWKGIILFISGSELSSKQDTYECNLSIGAWMGPLGSRAQLEVASPLNFSYQKQ